MNLLDNQLNESTLRNLSEEACRLLIARNFHELANKFGYAMAYNRDLATAIQADFEHCLSINDVPKNGQVSQIESVVVKNFKPNDTGLLTLIECVVQINQSVRVLVELIAAKNGEKVNLYLEDINAIA